jgi:glycosyltransferase involved in cell wall biosynthesis
MEPLVSIVIPCFNQGRFLGEAIDSALAQTHPNIEVIVVNDGSTDDTRSVAGARVGVRHIEQRNQGAPVARNTGFADSRGEFVIFLDADDRLLPDAVTLAIQSLAAHPGWSFVTGHVRLISEDGSSAGVPPQEHSNGEPYIALLRSNYIWTPGVVTYRRSALDAAGPFDPSALGSADYDLNIRIARRSATGCHHQVVLEYRQHGANMTGDPAHMLKSAVAVRRRLRKYATENVAAEQARRAGIRIVQEDFGGRLIDRVKIDLRSPGRRGRACRDLICLLQYYPAGVKKLVSDGLRRLAPMAR